MISISQSPFEVLELSLYMTSTPLKCKNNKIVIINIVKTSVFCYVKWMMFIHTFFFLKSNL